MLVCARDGDEAAVPCVALDEFAGGGGPTDGVVVQRDGDFGRDELRPDGSVAEATLVAAVNTVPRGRVMTYKEAGGQKPPDQLRAPVPLSQKLSPKATIAEKLVAMGGSGPVRLRGAARVRVSRDRSAGSVLWIIVVARRGCRWVSEHEHG